MKDNTEIVSCKNKWGHEIRFYDDGYGPLWVYRTSTGITGIIRAMTWEDAYECILDDILVPIPVEEIPEAYGFYGENAQQELENAEEPELTEGYHYQPNSSGSGIVSIDLNGEALDQLTSKLWKELELDIKIKVCDQL